VQCASRAEEIDSSSVQGMPPSDSAKALIEMALETLVTEKFELI